MSDGDTKDRDVGDGGRGSSPRRYLAGVPLGFELDDERRGELRAAGAEVLRYNSRLGVLTLEVADGRAFVAPEFVLFVEPDRPVGPA